MFLNRRLSLLTIRAVTKNLTTEAEGAAGSEYFKKIITDSTKSNQQESEFAQKSQNFARKFLNRQKNIPKNKKNELNEPVKKKPVLFEKIRHEPSTRQVQTRSEKVFLEPQSQIQTLAESNQDLDEDDNLTDEQLMEKEIKNLQPSVRPVVYNLAYYVNKNPVIRTLVEMGVFIRKWDQDPEVARFILSLDLDKDIKPRLVFLHDIGIPAENHAFIITKNPMIFKESIHDLTLRIEYLKSKKFSDESIKKILIQTPKWLSLTVQEVDTRLGWFQKEFNLTGPELRQVVTERPKLVTLPLKVAHQVKFGMTDFLSYSPESLKNLILKYPKLFTKNFEQIESNFIFLSQVAKLKHEDIEQYPAVLVCPLQTLKTRYSFLKALNRLQFDPTQPNYVSLKALCEPDEKIFCTRTAKTSLDEFKKFLKTL